MVAGHVCLDIAPTFMTVGRLVLAPGKLVDVGPAGIYPGGAVSNTGLALSLLGADVRLVGRVGADNFGGIVRQEYARFGCADDLVVDDNVATAYTVVIAVPGVDRIYLHHPGANQVFCAADVTDEALASVTHLHVGYPPQLRRLSADGGSELVGLFQRAQHAGVTTSLDMAAVDPESEAGRVDWAGWLANVLPYVDVFTPSIEELGFMLDRSLYDDWQCRAGGGDVTGVLHVEEDVKPLAALSQRLGTGVTLIKCGAPGMYYESGDATRLNRLCRCHGLVESQWAGLSGFQPAFEQPLIVSALGAGDTSIAAFLIAMLRGDHLARCVQLAAAEGACCVSAPDALSGLLPIDQLAQRIGDGWREVTTC